MRFEVVRVKNRFEDFDPAAPTVQFSNVNTNLVFVPPDGRRFIVEVQLHLRALFAAGKEGHILYEVIRAAEPREVWGPPFKFAPLSPEEDLAVAATELGRRPLSTTATVEFARVSSLVLDEEAWPQEDSASPAREATGMLLGGS